VARSKSIPLTETNLRDARPEVVVPGYARDRLTPSWVHIGVGGFHRAHQAVYLDDLATRHAGAAWGVVGVGLLAEDERMARALAPQQFLYTVVERGARRESARVIGAMVDYLWAPERREHVLCRLEDVDTRVVSLTITEGGYNFNQVTGEFDASSPEIQADLRQPSRPITAFGYICAGLDRLRKAGRPPFTVLSCDNLQGNGDLTRKMIVSFAALHDRALAAWIDENVAFPNCMVDRITPQTTDADRDMVAEVFGIEDAWPVMTEPFKQWVIEDAFCNGRPPLEEVGVQLVADVQPYETMKIRLLNASHQAMAYLGYLCGYRYVHEVMGDPLFQKFIQRLMDEEIAPLLAPVPGVDLDEYQRSLVERFANPKIQDQVLRLCFDGSARMPKFLLPSLHEALALDRPHTLLTLATAGWFRYLAGVDEQGEPIPVADQLLDELQPLARAARENARPLLGVHKLFDALDQDRRFVTTLQEMLARLYAHGARATLAHYAGGPPVETDASV
jgi:mannitol 2-dehydrogenase